MEHLPVRPVIGLTARWDEEKQRYTVANDYLRAVEAAGGVPALIPLIPAAVEELADSMDGMDGFILCGNPSDVDPARFGQPPHPLVRKIHAERDETDWRVLDHVFDHAFDHAERKPVLGVCFGMQSLNVYRGGTLVQHIPAQVPGALEHENTEHVVELDAGSRLAEWAGERQEIRVNSTHHQSVDAIGSGLRLAARSPDGVIEAVEGDSSDHFVVGVEWHPERIWETESLSARLFLELVRAAAKRRSGMVSDMVAGSQTIVETL